MLRRVSKAKPRPHKATGARWDPPRQHAYPTLTLRMLPPDFFTISSSTMDCRQMLSMMAYKREVLSNSGPTHPIAFPTHHTEPTPAPSLELPLIPTFSNAGVQAALPVDW